MNQTDNRKPRFVTCKEIAAKLEVSDDTVRRRERNLGLDRCRDRVLQRPRRYRTEDVERTLRDNGHEVTF